MPNPWTCRAHHGFFAELSEDRYHSISMNSNLRSTSANEIGAFSQYDTSKAAKLLPRCSLYIFCEHAIYSSSKPPSLLTESTCLYPRQRQRYARDQSSYHESIPFLIHSYMHHHHLLLRHSPPPLALSHAKPPTPPHNPKNHKNSQDPRARPIRRRDIARYRPPRRHGRVIPRARVPLRCSPRIGRHRRHSRGDEVRADDGECAHLFLLVQPSRSWTKHHLILPAAPPHYCHPTFSSTTAAHTSSRLSRHHTAPPRRSRSPAISA